MKDVYFENVAFDNVKHGDKTVVYIFLSIAVLILLIACINFMNLSTIRAVERSKEVGLRKVLGALRNNLGVAIYWRICFTNNHLMCAFCWLVIVGDALV